MKTAISAQNSNSEALIDKHFGKCSHFHIYDDVNLTIEVLENPATGISGCKGDVIVSRLINKEVKCVVAGDFGTKVQQLLNQNQIQMIIHPDTRVSVSEIIELLNHKNK
ncbi:MAG: NifB/NifX family molybdenum-iron cluster-binding protein [Bacteroidota bacterium]